MKNKGYINEITLLTEIEVRKENAYTIIIIYNENEDARKV